MKEEKITWEKPWYSLKIIQGTRGEFGWEIRCSGPDLKRVEKEALDMHRRTHEALYRFREEKWEVKTKKEAKNGK